MNIYCAETAERLEDHKICRFNARCLHDILDSQEVGSFKTHVNDALCWSAGRGHDAAPLRQS